MSKARLFSSLPLRLLAALMLASAGALPLQAADPPAGQIVGGIEAVVYICGSIDPKSAKTGTDMLATLAAQQKLDLPAVRKTDGYKSIYNSEVNRLLSLGAKERAAACKNAW
jgi:hypothetical protein